MQILERVEGPLQETPNALRQGLHDIRPQSPSRCGNGGGDPSAPSTTTTCESSAAPTLGAFVHGMSESVKASADNISHPWFDDAQDQHNNTSINEAAYLKVRPGATTIYDDHQRGVKNRRKELSHAAEQTVTRWRKDAHEGRRGPWPTN